MTNLFDMIDKFFAARGGRFWFWFITLLIMILMGLMNQDIIMGWPDPKTNLAVVDPDVWIRLTKVRELIQDGNLYNHAVIASNAPYGGMETPWTRPVDAILVFFYQFTPSDLSIEKRLLLVANWYPLIIEAIMLFFVLKAAETGFKSVQKIAVVAVYIIGSLITSKTHSYFMIGNVDHHSLQSLLWIISIWLLLDKPSIAKSAGLGVAMGIWFWISPEALPLIFMIFVILGLKSIITPRLTKHAVLTTMAVTLTTIFALFIEYPIAKIWTTLNYDNVSIIYAMFFSFCAGGFVALKAINASQLDIRQRFALAGITAAILAGIFLAIFPKFIKGPMAEVDPYIITGFMPRVWEATPILKSGVLIALTILYLPIVSLLLALRSWKRHPVLLALLFTPLVMVFFQLKWSFYLEAISIIAMAKLLPTYIIALRRKYKIHGLALQPIYPVILLHVAAFYVLTLLPTSKLLLSDDVSDCNNKAFQAIQSGALVAALGDKPLTIESNILGNSGIPFFTPYHYIASYYHREGKALRIKDTIFDSKDLNAVRPLLKERGVSALFICPFSGETWTNAYFYDKQQPYYDWVTIHSDLKLLNKTNGTVNPILLTIKP